MSTITVWTADDITVLKAAISSGVLTVTYNGPPARSVTYQSLPAMQALLAQMVAEVYAANRRAYRLAATRKGL